MSGTLSPPPGSGGLLHFPSPKHLRGIDPAAKIRQLRRSMSRTPSKSPFRLGSTKSASPSPTSPLSPSLNCNSPSSRSQSAGVPLSTEDNTQSTVTSPLAPSAPIPRQSTFKPSPMRTMARPEIRRSSPIKRTLSERADNGNATPRSSGTSSDDVENRDKRSTSPDEPFLEHGSKRKSGELFESNGGSRAAMERLEKGGSLGRFAAKSSPLKRSDGLMNLDPSYMGSPAKRRSLHGATFGADFNIFDQTAETQTSQTTIDDEESMDSSGPIDVQPNPSQTLKRTSSWRRAQRQEKPIFARSRLNLDLAHDIPASGQSSIKGRGRMSLDNHLPPQIPHDSPFSSQGGLPSASAHTISQGDSHSSMFARAQPSRHPLSRTISQSSSTSLRTDDSPTHIPERRPERHRNPVDFSKSLPVGSRRPASSDSSSQSQKSHGISTEGSFSTPENFRAAKPLSKVFASTGLISKKHRPIDDSRQGFQAEKSMMPDTPCKRYTFVGTTTPVVNKKTDEPRNHQSRYSFGTPSTPLSAHTSKFDPNSMGKHVSVFGTNVAKATLNRRASFLSNDGDSESSQSPLGNLLRHKPSLDFDLPPTPTKPTLGFENGQQASLSADGGLTTRSTHGPSTSPNNKSPNGKYEPTCKLTFSFGHARGGGGSEEQYGGSRSTDCYKVPKPILGASFLYPLPSGAIFQGPSSFNKSVEHPSPLKTDAKSYHLSPASPIRELFEKISPRTPQDAHTPPDPSGLSISAVANGEPFAIFGSAPRRLSMAPPATPTAAKDFAPNSSLFSASVTPTAASRIAELDPNLTARFDKVEPLGVGEFSRVYKVIKYRDLGASKMYFTQSVDHKPPQTSLREERWAVKKSRKPYIGAKDREQRLQEVHILNVLRECDHIVHYFDSWEEKNHLYIQTEFCEDGTLATFLSQAGQHERLDEFRVWKILLEIALGIKYIHDHSFLHLDLKPGNILITFEGVLKIADFGMATSWPAPKGIEIEGDREYIAPEVLLGECDKPSDIFALGLMMLEIAGNIELPDNGTAWQKLRSGDLSDVSGSLTYSLEQSSSIVRDLSGNALSRESSQTDLDSPMFSGDGSFKTTFSKHDSAHSMHPVVTRRDGELAEPPSFMVEEEDPDAIRAICRWLISPEAGDRPKAEQVLETKGVSWVHGRRRAGATIYEGNWGPGDEQLADDAEMIDV